MTALIYTHFLSRAGTLKNPVREIRIWNLHPDRGLVLLQTHPKHMHLQYVHKHPHPHTSIYITQYVL